MNASNEPQQKTASPLRGLAVGLLVALIFFPDVRESIVTTLGSVLAFAVGAGLACFVLLGGRRRR